MRHEEGGYGAGAVLLSFLFGGLVGAGVALLFAPRSGEETRKRIKELTGEVKEKTGDYVEQLKGKMTETVEKGKDFLQEKKSIIKTTVEAGKEAYEREKERLSKEKEQHA